MKCFEYRIQQIEYDKGEAEHILAREERILKMLNSFGKDGWRVATLLYPSHLTQIGSHIKFLLERELGDDSN